MSGKELPKRFEEGNSKVILIPRHVLIDYRSFLDVPTVPMSHILILLAEIGQNGSAFS